MPKTLTSAINSLRTCKKWTDLYAGVRRVLLILKEKLLHSDNGTLLQRYIISQDIPCLKAITRMRRSNKGIPVANVYTLRCGPQIAGGKRR